jgi:hypothetical protein
VLLLTTLLLYLGDELCGRIAALLRYNDGTDFCVLPPRFPNGNVLTEAEWHAISPHIRALGGHAIDVCQKCLAQIVYHWDWIKANISPLFPIFNSRLLTERTIPSGPATRTRGGRARNRARGGATIQGELIFERLRAAVLPPDETGYCEITHMQATGLPPHVDILREVVSLRAQVRTMHQAMAANSKEIMSNLPQAMGQYIVNNFSVTGVQQMTKEQVATIVKAAVEEGVAALAQHVSAPEPQVSTIDDHLRTDERGYPLYIWGGRMRSAPGDFQFPRGTTKMILNLFFTGVVVPCAVKPFQLLTAGDLPRKERQYFAKASVVFSAFCDAAVNSNLVADMDEFRSLSASTFDEMYPDLLSQVIASCNIPPKKFDPAYTTLYNALHNLHH